jgi:ribonuclease P protein component
VFAAKCSQADGSLVVYVALNDLEWSRLGLSVGKRVGKAVRRNYVRRRIREAFRTQKNELPKGLDIICVARPKAADVRCDLAHSLRTLVVRAARGLARSGNAHPTPNSRAK